MGSSRVEDSILADGVELQNSVVVQSEIGNGTTVGPFAYLRPGKQDWQRMQGWRFCRS